MTKYNFIFLLSVCLLFCNGSCKYQEGQRFIIQNNSDDEIIVVFSRHVPIGQNTICIKPVTKFEYEDFIHSNMISPHFNKNFERFGNSMLENPQYTILYIGVFNRIDMDTMSCEEFKQKYPLKKEWKVTLFDMEACDWTLVYP